MNLFKAWFFKLNSLLLALIVFAAISLIFNLFPVEVQAAKPTMASQDTCGLTALKAGSPTLSSPCTITGITGFTGGDLNIIGTNTIIRITSGSKLVLDPGRQINLTPPKGQILVETGGLNDAIVHGTLCIVDNDKDGYAADNAKYVYLPLSASQTKQACSVLGATYVEKINASTTEYDCNDNDVNTQDCCTNGYLDYDKDGDGSGAYGCYISSASYNVSANNYDCDDSSATIKNGWSSATFCGVGSCGGSGTQTCTNGSYVNTVPCVTSTKLCCQANGTYKTAQTPISTCLKCNGASADPVNQTSSEDLNNVCTTGSLGSGTSCLGANCSGSGDSCASLANGTTCNYGAYTGWTGANGACFATRSRNYYTCSSGACSATPAGTDFDANQNASTAGNVWNGSAWTAASCTSYCNIQSAYCSGQTLARGVYGCSTSGSCDNVTVRAACPPGGCTGGENSRCSGSSCVDNCNNGIDDDGDGFTDHQDVDCGGVGQCSSGVCCNTANGAFKSSATICSTGTFNSPASGSCQRVATDQYCSGSATTCSGATNNRYENAPTTGNVWNGSAWAVSTGSLYCGSSSPNTCSGQTVQKDAYGCNTSGACSTTANGYKINTGTICSGNENDLCQGGTCTNKCSNKNGGLYTGNDDGDAYVADPTDPDCGAQCTSGACCDTTTGLFRASSYTCRASADTCDAAETCSGASDVCPLDSKYNGNLCRNSVDTCDSADYCNGVSNSCIDSKISNGTLCRSSAGTCDAADYCNGSSNSCSDNKVASGTLCRSSVGSCDSTDYCDGSANTCTDNKVANGTICNYGSWSGYSNSAGSCYAQRSQPYYTCSSGTCSASVAGYNYDNSYGSSGQVWNGSAWATASGTNKCGTGSFSCSGNTSIQLGYYGCNGANSCSTYMGTYQYGTCSGQENNMCVSGYSSCVNMCTTNGPDNNGNGYVDNQDAYCFGCGQCTSGSCCNAASGCYYGTGTRCLTGTFNNPPTGSCQRQATDQYCSGGSSSCTGAYQYPVQNAPADGNVWGPGSWTSASCSYNASLGFPYVCSGNSVVVNYYGCNTSGGTNVSTIRGNCSIQACSAPNPYCCAPGGSNNATCAQCTSDANCAADTFVAGTYGCSGTNVVATWRNYYCGACGANNCAYADTTNTVVTNCASTGQVCSAGACTYNSCPAGTTSGYSVPNLSHGGSIGVTKSVGYRVGGGYYSATASCSNGTVTISGVSGPTCYSGYKYVYGSWYQSTYGYYDVCVLATCSAGSIGGYSYGTMNHAQILTPTRAITNGSCTGSIQCADGVVNLQSDTCVCNSGFDWTGSACVDCTSDSGCNTGYYCSLPGASFGWCNTASYNNCQKKCWYLSQTVNITYIPEGDVTQSTYVAGAYYFANNSCGEQVSSDPNYSSFYVTTHYDNPHCDGAPACPYPCQSGGTYGTAYSTAADQCYKYNSFGLKYWVHRNTYKCYSNSTQQLYYGAACAPTSGYTTKSGVVNEYGNCVIPSYCGDYTCNSDEDCSTCPTDCGYCQICGDGQCTGSETVDSCYDDCYGGGVCNYNYYCDQYSGESCRSCSSDCGGCYTCNYNGTCDYNEDYYSCYNDCWSTYSQY